MIEPSVFIARGAVVLGDVHIGNDSSVWYNAVIRGDTDLIAIGEATNIQDLSLIHADPGVPVLVGDRVTVGHRVILHGSTVENDCLIGMGAILLNRVLVGAGSVIGAARSCSKEPRFRRGRSRWARPLEWYGRWTPRCGSGSRTHGCTTWPWPSGTPRATFRRTAACSGGEPLGPKSSFAPRKNISLFFR